MSLPQNGTYGTMYYVTDMKKAVAFYRDAVGMKPGYESEYWTEFKMDGGHSLCLHWLEPGQKAKSPGGILIIRVKGIRETVNALRGKNIEFLGDIHEVHPGAYSADFRDSEGNIVSLYEDTSA